MLERGHVYRLMLWGAISILTGAMLLMWLKWRRSTAGILRHFAIQTAAWGAIVVLFSLRSWRAIHVRDYGGVQELLSFMWLNVGLDVGYAAVGTVLLITGWRWGTRLGGIGAGLAIIVQGTALAVLHLRLLGAIGPLR